MKLYVTRAALLLTLSVGVSACGGGGGGGGSSAPPPPPPPSNQAPTASFTVSATSGDAPLTVTVDANASSDADGTIENYTWDFAGNGAIGVVAQFVFINAGTQTITLTVTDDDGATASMTRDVTVNSVTGSATLTGTVQILNSSAIDADVHDRLTTTSPNNTFDQAQPLAIPATVGGYANIPGTGESTGNLFASGDPADFYQVSLNGDEVIGLSIAESNADLDLRLWDDNRVLVDSSMGTTPSESLEVTQAGNYFIEVLPVAGASNYVLFIGADPSVTSVTRAPTRLSDPIVTGEIIARYAVNHSVVQTTDGPNEPVREPTQRWYDEPVFRDTSAAQRFTLRADAATLVQLPAGGVVSNEQRSRMATLNAIKAMRADDRMAYAEPNLFVHTHATPDDSFVGSQWNFPAINLPLAWDITTGSTNTIVAVVDTGVLLNHPDLSNKLTNGYDFISDPDRARDGDGIDDNPNDNGDLDLGGSSSFHGTHVAGIAGAQTDNAAGVAGASWQTQIMPLRAVGKDGGTLFDIIQAVRYAAGLNNNSNTVPAQIADVINLSLGSSFSSQSEQDTYNEVRQAGVLVVASAGNESSTLPSYPASYDNVINVSATTITNAQAGYSNSGPTVDIAAPGGSNLTDLNGDGIGDGVLSTMGDDSGSGPVQFGYAALSGTSMAAPHVAGVIALMKAVHPAMVPAEFDAALVAGDLTDDLGAPGRDDIFGYGLINAQKAVIAAQNMANGQGTDPGPILTASASTLNFGAFGAQLSLTLQNVGTGTVTVQSVSANQPWVSITAPGDPSGLGEYLLNVDRNGLADGAYQATLSVTSDANDVEVNLIMQVSSTNQSADAGLHYIILVDENGDTAQPAVLVSATNGTYPFTINNVPFGQYRLFAGTDSDDDSLLCDAGEACGAYTTLDSPDFITVNDDLPGLEFESSFRVNLSISAASQADSAADHGGINISKPTETKPK